MTLKEHFEKYNKVCDILEENSIPNVEAIAFDITTELFGSPIDPNKSEEEVAYEMAKLTVQVLGL